MKLIQRNFVFLSNGKVPGMKRKRDTTLNPVNKPSITALRRLVKLSSYSGVMNSKPAPEPVYISSNGIGRWIVWKWGNSSKVSFMDLFLGRGMNLLAIVLDLQACKGTCTRPKGQDTSLDHFRSREVSYRSRSNDSARSSRQI